MFYGYDSCIYLTALGFSTNFEVTSRCSEGYFKVYNSCRIFQSVDRAFLGHLSLYLYA